MFLVKRAQSMCEKDNAFEKLRSQASLLKHFSDFQSVSEPASSLY